MSLLVEQIPLTSVDGLMLGWWRVSDPARLCVHPRHCWMSHGTFSDHRVCMSLAQQWAGQGHVAWVMEWRGHGASVAPSRSFDFEDVALLDVTASLQAWERMHPGQELVAATHSGGGLVLLMALLRRPQFSGCLQRMALFACQSHFAGVSWTNRAFLRGAAFLSRLNGGIPGKALGLGICDETHATMSSWFDWNLRRAFTGKDGFDYGAHLSTLPQAVMCLAAEADDWIAPVPAVRQFSALFSNPLSRFQLCGPGAGHTHRFGHGDVVHGRAAQHEVLPAVVNWLRDGAVVVPWEMG